MSLPGVILRKKMRRVFTMISCCLVGDPQRHPTFVKLDQLAFWVSNCDSLGLDWVSTRLFVARDACET